MRQKNRIRLAVFKCNGRKSRGKKLSHKRMRHLLYAREIAGKRLYNVYD